MTGDASPVDVLTDDDELLFRQVHPNWMKGDEPSSQAFKPTSKDAGRLSVARGSMTTAEAAFDLHTGAMGLVSAGTWAVNVGEVSRDPVSLSALGDAVFEPVPDPAHALIDFGGLARREVEIKAKLLLAAARSRGRLHPAAR